MVDDSTSESPAASGGKGEGPNATNATNAANAGGAQRPKPRISATGVPAGGTGSGTADPNTSAGDAEDAQASHGGKPYRLTVVKGKLSDAQEALRQQYRIASDTTDDFVHENPWKAVAFAALTGIIVGMLAAR
jgi:ElaB/YqjD/DUF883 family membrane-anchored ribosome-binding protein